MRKGRILLIDDDTRFQEFLRDVLEFEGYELTLHNGSECLNMTFDQQPQVILINYCPKGLRTSTLCGQLFRLFAPIQPPVILLSAFPEHQVISRNLPYDIFIPKPFDLWDFMVCMDELIHRQQQ